MIAAWTAAADSSLAAVTAWVFCASAVGLRLGDGRLGRFRPRLGVRNRLIRLRLQRVLVFGHLHEHVVEEAPERLLDVEAELFRQSVGVLSDLVVKSHAK